MLSRPTAPSNAITCGFCALNDSLLHKKLVATRCQDDHSINVKQENSFEESVIARQRGAPRCSIKILVKSNTLSFIFSGVLLSRVSKLIEESLDNQSPQKSVERENRNFVHYLYHFRVSCMYRLANESGLHCKFNICHQALK